MASLMLLLSSCENTSVGTDEDFFFHASVAGADLPVWVKGNTASGKFIIYINGGPGLTSIDVARADMFNWSEGLEENVAMVYYDQRGCGNAQGHIDPDLLTINQFVLDLDAIINVLNTVYDNPSIFLMAHSFGALIGARYLLTGTFQEKITGWISIDGAYNFDYQLTWQYRRDFLVNIANEEIMRSKMTAHWESALQWAEENPVIETREQKNQWRDFIGWPGERIIPEEIAKLSVRQYLGIGFASSYNPFPAYASQNLEIVNDSLNADAEGINLIPGVAGITIPSLLIWGRYDDLIPPEEGEVVFANFGTTSGQLRFRILPESSHEPFISDPEGFKSEVISFVNETGL